LNKLDLIRAETLAHLEETMADGVSEDPARLRRVLENAVDELIYRDNPNFIKVIRLMKRLPVTIEQFITDPEYLGTNTYWPQVVEDLKIMCPDVWVGEIQPTEVILTGAIGIAKTLRTNICLCYALYCLTCFENPHLAFDLLKDKPIVIGCTAARVKTARDNVYSPVRSMFLGMRYTQRYKINYDKDTESELKLTDINVTFSVFRPDLEHILGFDLIACSVEEANTMLLVEKSKKAVEGGDNAMYDQAERFIHEALNRRKSRFATQEKKTIAIGGIYVVSSANHEKDYTSKIKNNIKRLGKEPTQLVFDQRAWDVMPPWKYSKETFPILISTKDYAGKILTPEEVATKQYPPNARIEHVPITWLNDFTRNFDKAQRDIVGVSSTCTDVFIRKPEAIREAMFKYSEMGFKYFLNGYNYNTGTEGMPRVIEENLPTDKNAARVISTDLATSGDACGISMSRILGKSIEIVIDEEGKKVSQERPVFIVEFAISIRSSKGIEVDIDEVVNFIVKLKQYYGLNIVLFSFDKWQSKAARQRINRLGFKTKEFSTRLEPGAYEMFKSELYASRVILPDNEDLFSELIFLQKDETSGRIDHAPGHHNDISDSMVSSLFLLTTTRGIKTQARVYENGRPQRKESSRRDLKRRDRYGNSST
jgi:hypothetical protein